MIEPGSDERNTFPGLKLLKALAPFQFFSYIYNIQLITRYFYRASKYRNRESKTRPGWQ